MSKHNDSELIHFKTEDFQEQWTKVPNIVFGLPKQGLSDPAYVILSTIIRATNGWGKEWDAVKPSEIEAETGKSASTIRKCLDELNSKGLITLLYICQSCGSSAIEMTHREKPGFDDKGKSIKHKFVTFKCKNCGEDKKRPERRCMLNIEGLSADKVWKRQAVIGKRAEKRLKGKSSTSSHEVGTPDVEVGTPDVEVLGTPDVEVGTPDVEVLGTPDVEVLGTPDVEVLVPQMLRYYGSPDGAPNTDEIKASHDQQNSPKETLKEKKEKITQRTVVDHTIQEGQTEIENIPVCDFSESKDKEPEAEAEKVIASDPVAPESDPLPTESEEEPASGSDRVEPEKGSDTNDKILAIQKAFQKKFSGHLANYPDVRACLETFFLEEILAAIEKMKPYQSGLGPKEIMRQVYRVAQKHQKQIAAPETDALLKDFAETFSDFTNAKDLQAIRDLIEKEGLEICQKQFQYLKIQHEMRPVFNPIGYLINNARRDAAPPEAVAQRIHVEERREARQKREDKLYDMGMAICDVTAKHYPKIPRVWMFNIDRMVDLILEKMIDKGVTIDAVSKCLEGFLDAENHPGDMFDYLKKEFLPDFVDPQPLEMIERPERPAARIVENRKADAESLASILGKAMPGMAGSDSETVAAAG